MKKFFLLSLSLVLLSCGAWAQGGTRQPDPSVLRDPILEKDSKANLEKAWHYFKLKKAYRASLSRAEEIIAGYPNFSQLDEALYIAGMSNLYMAESKGHQPPLLSPEKHRDEARNYLSRLISDFPESKYRKDAEKELKSLGGAKEEKQQ